MLISALLVIILIHLSTFVTQFLTQMPQIGIKIIVCFLEWVNLIWVELITDTLIYQRSLIATMLEIIPQIMEHIKWGLISFGKSDVTAIWLITKIKNGF
jgi:hypothetical protein